MSILSSKEAKLIDEYSINRLGIRGESLMEKAGKAVAQKAIQLLKNPSKSNNRTQRIVIICGKGNNGGDGYSCAIHLFKAKKKVTLVSTVKAKEITGDAKIFHDRCRKLGIKIYYASDPDSVDMSKFHLIVDAILGTGVRGEIRQQIKKWIGKINGAEKPVLAVDVPSGISADNGKVLGTAVQAIATVTMGFLKQGLVLHPGAEMAGVVTVADIGYPDGAFQKITSRKFFINERLVFDALRKPPADTYKHRQGKVLMVGGSKGFTGAVCMAAESALRAGAGLVIAGVPESLNAIYESKLTEVITRSLQDSGTGRFLPSAVNEMDSLLGWCDVLAIGPGLGVDTNALQFAENVLKRCGKPLVIDADALRVFKNNLKLFSSMKKGFIMTPHHQEASDLTGVEKSEILEDPFLFIENLAREIGGVVVLKGAPTLIAFDDNVVVNPTGHQGLATAGSGDVLTGIIAGFLAQGMSPEIAAQVGVFIHGKTADSLLKTHGYRGLIATDLIRALPSVIAHYELH